MRFLSFIFHFDDWYLIDGENGIQAFVRQKIINVLGMTAHYLENSERFLTKERILEGRD